MGFKGLFSSGSRMVEKSDPKLKRAKDDTQMNRNVMKDAQREIYEFDVPQQELGMTDLLKQHKSGDRFLFAAVTTSQDEEESSRLRRLIQHQPRLSRKSIPITNLPTLALYKEVEIYKLSDLLPAVKKGARKTYINISEVLVVYGSLISSDSTFSKVKISIMDDRLLRNKIAKSYCANTNVISKATMSLSYSFPRDEVDAISLALSRDAAFLEEGRQWGAAQVQITMSETEFPIQTSNSEVRAINDIPQSLLEERDVNPDFLDISIMNNNKERLRELYMNGDLADETEPIKSKTEVVRYAKSSLTGPKGKRTDKILPADWSFMNHKRQSGAVAGDNSVEPSEDGCDIEPAIPLKSAMKHVSHDSESSDRSALQPTVSNDTEEIIREDWKESPPTPPRVRKVTVVDPNPFNSL